jgi:hypothetical protein
LAAAVIGVAAIHIGHVTGHQRAKQWIWLAIPAGAWLAFAIIVAALVVGFIAIAVAASSESGLSAEAISALAAAAIGVAGTHLGHVTGHQLGTQ